MPKVSIETFEDIKVLVVERFDRELHKDKTWIIRHPQEDMCQAQGVASSLKYESDGGPGIASVMALLKSSINPEDDRKQFMKTIFIFWLLGAIDGHAKNFSVFLKQGGRFELTPVYDVMSGYPLVAKRQLESKKMKLAMALHGKNTHYKQQEIIPRHWLSQARKVNFPESEMQVIIDETLKSVDSVIHNVFNRLPHNFPVHLVTSIVDGIRKTCKKL